MTDQIKAREVWLHHETGAVSELPRDGYTRRAMLILTEIACHEGDDYCPECGANDRRKVVSRQAWISADEEKRHRGGATASLYRRHNPKLHYVPDERGGA